MSDNLHADEPTIAQIEALLELHKTPDSADDQVDQLDDQTDHNNHYDQFDHHFGRNDRVRQVPISQLNEFDPSTWLPTWAAPKPKKYSIQDEMSELSNKVDEIFDTINTMNDSLLVCEDSIKDLVTQNTEIINMLKIITDSLLEREQAP